MPSGTSRLHSVRIQCWPEQMKIQQCIPTLQPRNTQRGCRKWNPLRVINRTETHFDTTCLSYAPRICYVTRVKIGRIHIHITNISWTTNSWSDSYSLHYYRWFYISLFVKKTPNVQLRISETVKVGIEINSYAFVYTYLCNFQTWNVFVVLGVKKIINVCNFEFIFDWAHFMWYQRNENTLSCSLSHDIIPIFYSTFSLGITINLILLNEAKHFWYPF